MITLPLRKGAANAHYTFDIQLGDNFLEFTLNYITLAPARQHEAAGPGDPDALRHGGDPGG